MNTDLIKTIIEIVVVITSVLLVIAVLLQPSQKTGLIGDATDSEKRTKRGFELFLHKFTIFLIVTLFGFSLLYGSVISGLIDFM